MWSRQVERRRHSLCLWKTRSKRWPCLCVGSVTDWLRLNISYMSCIFLKMWSFRVSKWMLKSSIISTLPDIVSQYSRNSGNWSKNMVSMDYLNANQLNVCSSSAFKPQGSLHFVVLVSIITFVLSFSVVFIPRWPKGMGLQTPRPKLRRWVNLVSTSFQSHLQLHSL